MAQNSKIEWTDHTVNLWHGCAKKHTGCKNCYAETLAKRWGNNIWGEKASRKRIKSATNDLIRYQRIAVESGIKQRVFVGSMMDIFEDDKPLNNSILGFSSISDLRTKLFEDIYCGDYQDLIFLFLTKRPRNIDKYLPPALKYRSNLWFGTSISDPETIEYGIHLLDQDVKNRFLSIEPQIARISESDIGGILNSIDWIIQGGESGPKKRPFNIDWAYEMKEISNNHNTPYFFKQIDKVQSIPENLLIRELPNFNQ
ncbi:MAG: DUF5131 family protein [Bacteroidota bacterium]